VVAWVLNWFSRKIPKEDDTGMKIKRNDSEQLSIKNIDLVKKHEGLRLEAYLPTPNDVWTIGYGHTHTTKQGQKITEAQAEALLRRDITWAEKAVNKSVVVPLTQNQFDALVSFVFNVGEGAFATSTLLRLLNSGEYEGAANQFLRWNRQKGRVLNGLTKRREEERALFLK
jgi:lysozyme